MSKLRIWLSNIHSPIQGDSKRPFRRATSRFNPAEAKVNHAGHQELHQAKRFSNPCV